MEMWESCVSRRYNALVDLLNGYLCELEQRREEKRKTTVQGPLCIEKISVSGGLL